MGVVHVGWTTLDKRVREFSSSAASALTPREFEAVAQAAEEQTALLLAHVVSVSDVCLESSWSVIVCY